MKGGKRAEEHDQTSSFSLGVPNLPLKVQFFLGCMKCHEVDNVQLLKADSEASIKRTRSGNGEWKRLLADLFRFGRRDLTPSRRLFHRPRPQQQNLHAFPLFLLRPPTSCITKTDEEEERPIQTGSTEKG